MRESFGNGIAPNVVVRALREVWLVDLLLSPIGLLAAYATVLQPHAYLLVLPLVGLLTVFAHERRERIDNAIELSSAYRGTALLLGDVLTSDDEYTGTHSQSVVELALTIADELGVDDDQRRLVEFGAMLHDIGKITTPDDILNKPGPLDDEEWDVMRDHTLAGQRLLDRVGGTLHDVGLVVRSSHEHYDGSGYPDGLAGAEIPLAARIVAVADAYSAMTTRRSYRDALDPRIALAELSANAGTQFDPVVAAAAIRVLGSRAVRPPCARARGSGSARRSRRRSRSRGRSATSARRTAAPSRAGRTSRAARRGCRRSARASPRACTGTTGLPCSRLPWWLRMMCSTASAVAGSKPSRSSMSRRTR